MHIAWLCDCAGGVTMKKFARYAGGFACAAFIHSPAIAVDYNFPDPQACAISAFNGKIGFGAGLAKDDARKGARFDGEASLSIPIDCSFGLQLDGALGSLDSVKTGGGAVHAFTRDPNSYLLGAYGDFSRVGSNDIWRAGIEAEYYLDMVTVSGVAGYENSDLTNGDVFAALDISYYATSNFRISAGYRHFLDINAAAFGVEYQLGNLPASVFVTGQIGEKGHRTALAGLRFYFGGADKSLVRRHREDDPFVRLNQLKRNIVKPAATTTTTPGGETGGEVGGETGGEVGGEIGGEVP